jgi:hypothetical protein
MLAQRCWKISHFLGERSCRSIGRQKELEIIILRYWPAMAAR